MKKQVLLFFTILTSIPSFSQNTFVPDDHFEQALIDLGLDDILNDSVATGNIDTLSLLDITWKNIENLTGIETFSSLSFLNVGFNQLTSLDLSQNTQLSVLHCELNDLTTLILGNNPNLTDLFCRGNILTDINLNGLPELLSLSLEDNFITQLDLSNNPLLDHLNVQNNPLLNLNPASNPLLKSLNFSETPITTLNVSQNTLLHFFICISTPLTELDLSQNPAMLFLHCANNSNLHSLNLKNGNNTSLLTFDATGNPELFCIQVDTPSYSQQHWSNIDSWASFQEDCMLGLEESAKNAFSAYPNPAADELHFSVPLEQIIIRDISGRTVKNSIGTFQTVTLSELPAGLYLLIGRTNEDKSVSIRFIRENR